MWAGVELATEPAGFGVGSSSDHCNLSHSPQARRRYASCLPGCSVEREDSWRYTIFVTDSLIAHQLMHSGGKIEEPAEQCPKGFLAAIYQATEGKGPRCPSHGSMGTESAHPESVLKQSCAQGVARIVSCMMFSTP